MYFAQQRRILLVAVFIALLLGSVLLAANLLHTASSSPNSACNTTSDSTSKLDANAPPPLYLGLDAYRHWDKLSYLELGDRVEGQSTADPGGSNHDNVQIMRTLPDGERVLFDQTGPAIVTFMRMQEQYGAPWNLSLDNMPKTTISPDNLGQANPTTAPANAFPYPLSLNPSESQGSSILATAIPFSQHLTWASQHPNGNFYALYRKLPYGTPLPAWDDPQLTQNALSLLRCAGSDIAPTNISHQEGTLSLHPSQETTLATLAGPSQIRALSFKVPINEMAAFGNARLRIYWDNRSQPDVDAPVKFLAGDGAGVYVPSGRPLVDGLLANIQSGDSSSISFDLYWPMPFAQKARITLLSNTPLSSISWNMRYEPFPDPPSWWGTFHATYTSIPHPVAGQDMTFLDARGSGKLVGTVINFSAPDSTLEGDPRIYLDDSQTPQIAVTGTEEWGLGGDYWHGGQQVSLPLGGLPSSINNPPGSNIDGSALYRFLIADSIPFNRHLIVRWEHGGADESTHPYRAVMLWYGTPTVTAQQTGEIQSADAGSRSSHSYQASGEQTYTLSAAYQYTVSSPLLTMNGTRLSGTATFRLGLDPRNTGAFLRRTFDGCIANQRANIYVDGHFAGTWYDAGAAAPTGIDGHPRCWRDEDFPLPASLTAGKSSLTIKIVFVPTSDPQDSAWTAFRYQLYSFVMPGQ